MLINALNNIYREINFGKGKEKTAVTRPNDFLVQNKTPFNIKLSEPLKCDTVSFSGKNYGKDSILHPTEHCAYCGQKVYDEQQIDGIAKEILGLKSSRLEGKVRSVLEKLTGATNAPELALAKEIENKDHIEFFKTLSEASQNKPYAKGEELISETFSLDHDDALKTLNSHLHPLLSTIDHVSPQRLEQENNNVDANLVEACYCCNHDIKKGINFREFYTMFPSIEQNMPKEKFTFAKSELLEQEASGIEERLSAATLIKHADLLVAQRTDAQNALKSVNHRLDECKTGIEISINEYKNDIKEKEEEISGLEIRLEDRKKDPEFNAMLRRKELQDNIKTVNNVISSFNDQKQRISNSINDLQYEKKGKKKSPVPRKLTPEEQRKLESNKTQISHINIQINQQIEKRQEYETEVSQLNEKYPPIEHYQQKKNEADAIYNAHVSLENETVTLKNARTSMSSIVQEEKVLKQKADKNPVKTFTLNSYAPEQQEVFKEYKGILEALDFIEKHQSAGGVKARINTKAKVQLEQDLEVLKKEPVIQDYLKNEEYQAAKKELKSLLERKAQVQKQISSSQNLIEKYKKASAPMSKTEAKEKSEEYSNKIYILNDMRNDLEIPTRIEKLKANIELINGTIDTLSKKLQELQIISSK